MGDIIDLSSFTGGRSPQEEKIQAGDLTSMLKQATILRQELEEFKETVAVMDFAGLKRVFETRLANLILKAKNIGTDFFLCGNYIAALLAEIGNTVPESWFAVDYFVQAETENNPTALKQGANVCFLICSVFPKRSNIRNMKYDGYESLGRGLYYSYYNRTGTAVAYFMSRQFKPMAEITKKCLRELK